MLQWNEQFETGSDLLDAQHRMLISYINRLEEFAQTTNPSVEQTDIFMRSVEFLETYALSHFNDEEKCMARFKCPAYQDNHRGHLEFIDFYRGFNRRLGVEGCRRELVLELYDACVAWIRKHILRIDVQLKASIRHPQAAE